MEEFADVIKSNDVEALKTALQNLLILFETQNRNYTQLKQEVKKLKTPLNLQLVHSQEITILPEDSSHNEPRDSLLDFADQTLASLRLTRKLQTETNTMLTRSLEFLIHSDETPQSQNLTLFDST